MIVGGITHLRPIEREDLPRYVSWFGDAEVRRHLLVYLPFSLAQEEQWFAGMLERLAAGSDVVLAVETTEGVHIGSIGLHGIDWKNRHAELGIVIGAKSHWGQGYGSDAIRTLLRLAFEEMNLNRIFLHVDADNLRAIRCYEKCGFQTEGTMRQAVYREGMYHDQLLMSILCPEYEASS